MTDQTLEQARLDAVALVRSMLANDDQAVSTLLALTEDPRETARAAAGFAVSLLAQYPEPSRARILDALLAATLRGG